MPRKHEYTQSCDSHLKSHRNPTYSQAYSRPLQSAPRAPPTPEPVRRPTLTQRHARCLNRLIEALIALQNSAPPSTKAPTRPRSSNSLVFHAFTVAQTTVSGSTVGCKRAKASEGRGRTPLAHRSPPSFTELHSPSTLHASR